jgi:hypothetical protein
MTIDFEWQTEEENEKRAPGGRPPAPWRAAAAWKLGLVLVALLIAVLLFWRARARVDTAAGRVQAEVRAAHALVERAAQARDTELLTASLSGRDRDWTRTQLALAERGLLFEPYAFGLRPAGHATTPIVHLAPDLSTAEVMVRRTFTATATAGSPQTIQLQQTFVYRRGARRWLWSPPDAAFWGETAAIRYRRLQLHYPQRDGAVAARLGADLNRLIERLCNELDGVACPPDYTVRVRLETNKASLLHLTDWQRHLRSGRDIVLPTPGLAGIPTDEAGYQALWRGYARLVAGPVLANLAGYVCCDRALSFQDELQMRLEQLGLGPWPGPPAAVPLPQGELHLYCAARSPARRVLFSYRPRAGAWDVLTHLPDDVVPYQQAFLAGGALLMLDVRHRLLLLRGDEQIVLAEAAEGVSYALGESDPSRTKIAVQKIQGAAGTFSHWLFDLSQCSRNDCSLQARPLAGWPAWSPDGRQTLLYARRAEGGDSQLVILPGDANGLPLPDARPITTAAADFRHPFWLDPLTYGFIRSVGDGTRAQGEVVVADAATGHIEEIVPLADLIAAVPGADRHFIVSRIAANPADATELLLKLVRSDDSVGYYVRVNWQSGRVQPLPPPLGNDTWAYYAPHGRWLALLERDPILPGKWTLFVYDGQRERRMAIGRTVPNLAQGPVWSGDGQWLVNAYGGYLSLTAPAAGYTRLVTIPEDASCQPLRWVDG